MEAREVVEAEAVGGVVLVQGADEGRALGRAAGEDVVAPGRDEVLAGVVGPAGGDGLEGGEEEVEVVGAEDAVFVVSSFSLSLSISFTLYKSLLSWL